MSDEDVYNERLIAEIDDQDYVDADNNEGKNGGFYGNDLAFEMQIRNPKSEDKFEHLNRDLSGAFYDRWDKASILEELHFLDVLEMLDMKDANFDLSSLRRSATKKVFEISVVSQGVNGNLQKTRITRNLNRSSLNENKGRSRFGLFNRGVN